MAKDPLVIDESKGQANQQQAEIDAVISMVNSGLENMSSAELARAMQLLQKHRGEVNDEGRAFTRLATFVQGELDKFVDNKKSYNDQEYKDVENLSIIVAEGQRTPEAIARQKAVQSKISQNIQQKRANSELLDLKPADATNLEANLKTVDKMLEGYDPLAKNAKNQLVNQGMQTIVSYFDHLDLDTSSSEGCPSKEELLKDIMELATLQAQSELTLLNYAKVSDEKKQKLLNDAITSHADALVLKMIQAQMLSDFQAANKDLIGRQNLTDAEKDELAKRVREFEAKCSVATKGYIERDYSKGNVKLSNVVATACVIEGSLNLVERNTQIAKKTGFDKLKENALKFDTKMKAKHPKIYTATQKAMISGVVGLSTGGVGLAALAAYRSGEVIYKSYKSYKESGVEGNYGKYLLNNPKEILTIGSSVALTAVSAYFGVNDLIEHGGNAAGVLGKTLFSDGARQEIGNRVTRAAIRGSISVTSGLSNAMIDVRAALVSKDAAEKKQLWKNAAKTAGLSIVAGVGGLVAAEYAGDGINWLKGKLGFGAPKIDTNQIDGITGAAVKVNSASLANTDLSKLNPAEMDDKLFKLGIKPDIYKDMSDIEKTMLLRQRTTELGDLAKENTTADKTSEGNSAEEQAPTESQLKNMLKRNTERHPNIDLNKVYDQFKAAGIKNPEEAFYKLEQSRLLAPNDKIMTIDGTNIRQTMERALKGEALTAADLKIIGASGANVDNTGHYLNDVRSQGGSGYSYRPRGVEAQNEQISGNKTGANINIKAEDVVAGAGANVGANSTASTDQEQIEQHKEEQNNIYRTVSGDGHRLIAAKHEAFRAENAYKAAVNRVKLTEAEVKATSGLATNDPQRVQAELKHAQAMKDEVKKQMDFSKAEVKLNKAQVADDLHRAKKERSEANDAVKLRDKMEKRLGVIDKKLAKLGIDSNTYPQMTGNYDVDRQLAHEYLKTSVENKENYEDATKLLREKQLLNKNIVAQGPRETLYQAQSDAEARITTVKSEGREIMVIRKRDLYTSNEAEEVKSNSVAAASINNQNSGISTGTQRASKESR